MNDEIEPRITQAFVTPYLEAIRSDKTPLGLLPGMALPSLIDLSEFAKEDETTLWNMREQIIAVHLFPRTAMTFSQR